MTTVHEQIENFLNESLQGSDCFVISFKVKPTNNYKIYIDSDTGFTLEKSIKINRSLRRMIEENELYPDGDFSLEVSSPGIDTPLVLHRQYVKNIGRSLEIELLDEAAKGITGKLIAVEEDVLVLEERKLLRRHEKAPIDPTIIRVPLVDIKTATVVVEI